MLVIAAFWLLLALPGFALLRRLRCPWLAYGLPSTITLSYLTSFALLSPISIAGYALQLPLSVLSASAVAMIALSAASLWIHDRSALRRVRLNWWAVLLSVLIAVDALIALRSGTHTAGDAVYHTSRVRMLLDFGFNNWDPLVGGHRFDAVYHSNIYHALLAVSAQLARKNATDAWVFSWLFSTLITVGAAYFVAFVTLGRRWIAWAAAGMFCVWHVANSVMAYPNTLSAYLFFPLALGFTVEALTRRRSWLPAYGFGMLALVSVQIHGLYYVLWCSLVAPPLLAKLVYVLLRRRTIRRQLFAAVLALGVGVPWLAVTALHRAPNANFAAPPSLPAAATGDETDDGTADEDSDAPVELEGIDRGFLQFHSGLLMFDPSGLWDLSGVRCQALLAIAAGLFTRRRRQFAAFGAVVLMLHVVLYVPFVCTLLVKLLGAPWIVKRYVVFHEIAHAAVCPFALFLFLPLHAAGRLLREGTRVVALALALGHGWVDGVNYSVWTHKRHFRRAFGAGRKTYLRMHQQRRAFFERTIPLDQTVLINPALGPNLVIDCPCYPLALTNMWRGVEDIDQRRADVAALLGSELDLPSRQAILRRYGVRYIVLQQRARGTSGLRRMYRPITEAIDSDAGLWVLRLDLSREPRVPKPWSKPGRANKPALESSPAAGKQSTDAQPAPP